MPVLSRVLLASGVGGSAPVNLVRLRVEGTERIIAMFLNPDPGVHRDQCVRRTRQGSCRAMLSGVAV
jgi:hypothetical protein